MEELDIEEVAEVNFVGENAEMAEVRFKNGSTQTYNGKEHPEILELLNHWTPPMA